MATIKSGNYTNQYEVEMLGASTAQANVLPKAAEMELQMAPGLQYANNQALATQAASNLGIYGTIGSMSAGMQAREMGNQINMLGAASTQATNAYMNSLPVWAAGSANAYGNYAMQQMQLGTSLSQEDQTYATQNARAAFAARGMMGGNQAIGSEILNNYNLGQQRLKERMGYAQTAFGMGQQIQQGGYQMFVDPAYKASQLYSTAGIIAGAEAAYQNLGPKFLTPESQYLANIRSNDIAMQNAQAAAAATRSAGMYSGLGAIAGGLIALCWVAREVYGSDNYKWLVFRDYVLNDAPEWFRSLYIKHGEKFAEFIKDKPVLKYMVRKMMDVIVNKSISYGTAA